MKAMKMELKSFVTFVEREGAASLMLAPTDGAATEKKSAAAAAAGRTRTDSQLMKKLAQQGDKAETTTVESMGAKTGAARRTNSPTVLSSQWPTAKAGSLGIE